MNEKQILAKVKQFAIKNSEQDDIHGFSHVKRVYSMCIKIGKKLDANLFILKIAALLHDIGRVDEKSYSHGRNHAEISAFKAKNFLNSDMVALSQNDIDNIFHAIRSHSFSNKITPRTLEAKILSDVDKLDAIGAIGIYRTIGYTLRNNGGIDQVIEHLENKILKLKKKMFLDYSKTIADKRHEFVLEFYNKIKKEKN